MKKILLATTSETRKKILISTGIKFICKPPLIDEEEEKEKIKKKAPEKICQILAKKKSTLTSLKYNSYYVLGIDTCIIFKKKFLSKPKSKKNAEKMLVELNGKKHKIYSSIYISKKGKKIWSYNDKAILEIKKMKKNEIKTYIKKLNQKKMESSGLYQIEDMGIKLFKKINGSYFTILGLPLIPLLNFLRKKNFI